MNSFNIGHIYIISEKWITITVKDLKIRIPKTFAAVNLKFEQNNFAKEKWTQKMQTVWILMRLETVWSGFLLFAKTYKILSEKRKLGNVTRIRPVLVKHQFWSYLF